MNLTNDPSVCSIVEYRARWLSSACPDMDFEDVSQELWIETLKAKKRYQEERGAQFPTFLFHHLRFRALNMLRAYTSRRGFESAYARESKNESQPTVEGVERLIEKISERLLPQDRKVLKQLVQPDSTVMLFREGSRRENGRNVVSNVHIASYLCVSNMTVSRSIKRIKSVVESVLNDRRRR